MFAFTGEIDSLQYPIFVQPNISGLSCPSRKLCLNYFLQLIRRQWNYATLKA